MHVKPLHFVTFILLLSLAGCATPPVDDQPPTQQIDNELVEQAGRLIEQGDHARAALLYMQVANSIDSPAREHYLLLTAEQLFLSGDTDGAAELLDGLPALTPALEFRRRLLAGELALQQDQAEIAFSLLQQPLPESASPALKLRYHKARAESFRQLGNILESASELSRIDPLIEPLSPRLDNQFAIIETLAVLTDTALDLLQPYPPGELTGWMELTRIIKEHAGEPLLMQPRLEEWHERFPDHPAMPELLNGYFTQLKAQYRRAKHIAVLLPRSGPYVKPANALRDGILAAYYAQPAEQRPELVFYDNSDTAATWPLYQQAVESGADMVIGPLVKEAVEQFTRAGELPIPVLALNQVAPEVAQPEDLYQFGLSPEDEARQVAERAWSDGFNQALALLPEGDWGERTLDAFRNRWEQLGGELNEYQTYNPAEYDFAQPIRGLLNLDQSDARRQDIQQLLGKRLEFEPRRRRDTDFIFLLARPQNARQIRPQLQFHHAADLPVYTTSHIYSGEPDPLRDQDLEGLLFPDIPWLLIGDENDPLARENIGNLAGGYPRLYAMGLDSYRLIPHLARLQNHTREVFQGATGHLYLDEINHIHRQLVWAQVVDARPQILGFTPRLELDSKMEMESSTAPDDQPPTPATGDPASVTLE